MDPSTDVGPLATKQILDDLESQVQRAVSAGATVLTGGHRAAGTRETGKGYAYEPTVLTGIPRSSDVFREEFFGPVAMLFRVRDAAEAIELANDIALRLGPPASGRRMPANRSGSSMKSNRDRSS